jgi:GTPase SAR1 family protein
MSSSQSESKLYNIYFFGDIKSSEKLFENLPEKKDLTKELEIHGEKINLNIIEHPDISIVSNEDKKANGILLFYNVTDVDSFNKLKETIEKIIDMNKYEMPLIVVGNNPNNQERKVNEEEAKTFLEKYGIKYPRMLKI